MPDKIIELLEDALDAPDCIDVNKLACQLRDIAIADYFKGEKAAGYIKQLRRLSPSPWLMYDSSEKLW